MSEDSLDSELLSLNITSKLPELRIFNPKKFSKECIPHDKKNYLSVTIVAPRNSGKNVLLKDLYLNCFKSHYEHIVIFSRTIVGQFDYMVAGIVDAHEIYDELTLRAIVENNKIRKMEGKPIRKVLVIFDDISGKQFKENEFIKNIYKEGRHSGISIITLVQDYKLVNTEIRGNTNLWILLNQKVRERSREIAKEHLYCMSDDEVMGGMKELDFWSALINKYTVKNPFNALMVFTEPFGREFNFENCVLQYKAKN